MADRPPEGTSALKRTDRYTYRDYRTWPPEERWELIDGYAWSMSPAPRRVHQRLIVLIAVELQAHFAGHDCKAHVAPCDVFLVDEDESIEDARHVVQPDAFVVCDERKLIDEGVKGAPDLVIEVLSSATAMKDQTEKRNLYETHGVREYWVVNPDTFEVLRYTLSDGRFGLPTPADLRQGVDSAIFAGLRVRVRPEEV